MDFYSIKIKIVYLIFNIQYSAGIIKLPECNLSKNNPRTCE